ncbi:hypothetical protein EDD38_7311 [Kitasatospora cineracea]|uniref:Uncharacterized protein n=1 Tax=Kitasatospora cineracea TaxID=88074 RepID=A0A3N4R377_9ACTN|nr:hypothetical protein EDD38_7311 [Kitasatospora cineracea]
MLVGVRTHAPYEVIDLIVVWVVWVGESNQQLAHEREIPRVSLNDGVIAVVQALEDNECTVEGDRCRLMPDIEIEAHQYHLHDHPIEVTTLPGLSRPGKT